MEDNIIKSKTLNLFFLFEIFLYDTYITNNLFKNKISVYNCNQLNNSITSKELTSWS